MFSPAAGVSQTDAASSQSDPLGRQNVTQPRSHRFDPHDTRRSSPAVCFGSLPLSKVTPLKFSCIIQLSQAVEEIANSRVFYVRDRTIAMLEDFDCFHSN